MARRVTWIDDLISLEREFQVMAKHPKGAASWKMSLQSVCFIEGGFL